MSRINVLWVIDHVCYDGNLHGGGRLYWNVLPRFDEKRFRVVPCMLRADDTIRQVFKDSPVPVRTLDKARFDPTTLATFLRLIRKERIQVMHLHCYAASTFGRLAGLLTGVPTVIHDYDTEVYFPYPSYLSLADRLLAPVTRRAMAGSPMVQSFLMKRRKIDPSRIELMLHAIPMQKFSPVAASRIAEVRRQLEIAEDAKVIGTITKLGPQRGNEYLLRAAAEVLKASEKLVFLLVHKPTLFHRLPSKRYVPVTRAESEKKLSDLQALARQLGIERNVRFVERTETTEELAASCDLIVAPFLSERFSSVSLLEALALGKPVIATDLGEQHEIVENGRNGYLVSPGDVQGLAKRILQVVADPDELERLSRGARETAQRYSVDACVERLQQLYSELASRQPEGGGVGG